MAQTIPVLHQFTRSHFNEKARWALDWKGIPHRRVTHLPGPHMFAIRRMTGRTQVPVLVLGDGQTREVVGGSARILARLDEIQPSEALLPSGAEDRAQALALQTWLDDEVGPAVRTVVFSVLLEQPDFLCRIFAGHLPPLGRSLYRATFPLARKLMARANGAERPDQVATAFEVSERALDRIAGQIGGKGYLVGDRFGLADLAAAALLAPLANPQHPDMASPEPVPDAAQQLQARFAGHAAIAWVHEQYVRHRPPSCAVAA